MEKDLNKSFPVKQTTATTVQAKMEGFALNIKDPNLLSSDGDKQMNESKGFQRKYWLEKELNKKPQLNGRTNSLFMQRLLDIHKSSCLFCKSCDDLNEINLRHCLQKVQVKAEPEDYMN